MSEPTTFGPKTARRILDFVDGRESTASNVSTALFAPTNTITFRNDSNETVPAYGCMKLIGAEVDATTDRFVVVIDKPNNVGGIYLFNGPREVATGERGQSSQGIVRAKYVSGGTPTIGQYWGPIDSWEISQTGYPAIQVYGDLEGDTLYGKSTDGAFVEIKVKPTADVSPGFAVSSTIYEGQPPSATTQEIPEVWLDWETGGEQISADTEATAGFYPIDGVWRFTSAACEGDAEPQSKIGSATDTSKPDASTTTYVAYINSDGVFVNDAATWVSVSASTPA